MSSAEVVVPLVTRICALGCSAKTLSISGSAVHPKELSFGAGHRRDTKALTLALWVFFAFPRAAFQP